MDSKNYIYALVIVIFIILFIFILRNENNKMNLVINNINGVYELDGSFAKSANLTNGYLVLHKEKDNLISCEFNGTLVFMDDNDNNDQIKVSEIFTLTLNKIKLIPHLLMLNNQINVTLPIKYLNKKSIILPDDEIKLILDNKDHSISLVDSTSDKLYGLFYRNANYNLDKMGDVEVV